MGIQPIPMPTHWHLMHRPQWPYLEAEWPSGALPLAILIFQFKKVKNLQQITEKQQNSKAHSFLGKRKFKSESVTGSKQKHMAISSIAGLTCSLK